MKLAKSGMVTIAMAASITMLVAGCGSTPTNNSTNNSTSTTPSNSTTATNSTGSSSSSTPTPGGTINLALPPQTNLNWFLPLMNAASDSVYNSQIVDQLYKPLIWINNDYTINWQSSIASKITYNKAGTVYHVFLNPKWKWSDGQPVTSKDVLFTWNVIKAASAKNAPSPWPFVGAGTGDIPNGVKSVVANSPTEVTITLDKPANQQWFIYNGIIQLTPMPAHAWDKKSNIDSEIKYLGSNATNLMFDSVVDGPFKPVSATSSQSWVIAPNPNYAGHKSVVNKIVFTYEGSTASELAALKSGSLNVGYLDQSQLGEKSSLTSQGDKITPGYPFGIFWTEMNMWPSSPTKSIFDQLYVRQALQMGLDNQGAAQDIYKGYAVPLFGPIPSTPKTTFLDPNLKNPYPFNINKGKQLLESHGWKEVNGVMTKGSQKMKFTMMYVSGSTSSTDAAELMKQDWAQEGVDVTLKPVPFSTFISVTSNPKDTSWDLATGSGWVYNGPGFYPTGGQLFASTAPSGTGFSNAKEDALIQATHVPYATQQQTMQHFFQYEDYTAKELPFLWGLNVAGLSVTAPTVHNVNKYADPATDFPQMQYWWVSSN
ncbi:peptide ABC transporter substrate-binding protein [Alicyclobacillus mengziensis]|uniref:Peptide ABC transporter substrate-binding protein n=1 Tax=Alicyclobacillus mengziensis TaxID=2931921 RepID=A0A9X7Z7X3_9BACL|nr:peptide ABC transporter substrate-binding protein [Alicyclobacillus mengziensis]QSO48932.1 peptide ABC transporter substrate-binding protein [Alicyclobacillus mengziensis]